MRIEIVRASSGLKREVWSFDLSISYAHPCIYFDSYSFQTKLTTRHKKWTRQTHWVRLDQRSNNINIAPLPEDVVTEMYVRFQEMIKDIPIVK